ncbi:MAG TPA: HAMP domain-containing sensor histidine kinase [Gaiellaceae bacterium]|nr:HAMP domain-containing sensor histidine kinase [Gaiellaceae bacterium]
MGRIRVGMRWWLAGGFAAIAVLTAALTAALSSHRVDRDVQRNAREIAIGQSVSSALAIERAISQGRLRAQTRASGVGFGLALYVFDREGRLVAEAPRGRVQWQSVPGRRRALASAIAGRRLVENFGTSTLVALPLRRTDSAAALVAYAPRPSAYGASLSIFRSETARAAAWGALLAATLGFVLAWLVSRRLRRIARAARAIEHGAFDTELQPSFNDEIGELTATVDAMRRRLGDAFTRLEAERDRLELLLDRLHEGVIAVDADLSVQYANASMRGRLPDLRPGVPLPDELDDLPLRTLAGQLFVRGAPVAEARSHGADGATYSLVGIPAAGTELAVLVVADITADERRRRAEREFVANASHELRTPVSAIASAVEALELGARDEPAERDRFIGVIGRQANRLSRLTRSLLVLARAQTREEGIQLVPVELGPLLERVAEGEPSAQVRVDCVDAPAALAQPDMLEQVVANLVANAVKHAPGCEVTLTASRNGGESAVIEVADRGPGIPAEVRARVFDRFYSGSGAGRDGFGLGLAIARDSAIAMRGRLELESSPGAGTTARVVLRVA